MLDVDVEDQVVLLVNVEGAVHAVSAWCPHLGTALALGRLSGATLTCFAHLWSFHVPSGEPLWPPMARVARGYRLRTFPVRVEAGEIFVQT
jgi:nitrite reductase/ring-hydroxylating ferredoxin subunit